jgi:hypothetical protein
VLEPEDPETGRVLVEFECGPGCPCGRGGGGAEGSDAHTAAAPPPRHAVRRARLAPVYAPADEAASSSGGGREGGGGAPRGLALVCASTDEYRRLALSQVGR